MTPIDSPKYLRAHRKISLAFGALRTSFLTALESVHGTWLSPGHGHHLAWHAAGLPARTAAQAAHAATPAARHRHACARARPLRCAPRPSTSAAGRDHRCCSPTAVAGSPSAPRRRPRLHAAVNATQAGPALLPWLLAALAGAWVTSPADALRPGCRPSSAAPCPGLLWPEARRVTCYTPLAAKPGTASLTPLGCSHGGRQPAPPSLPRRIALSPFVWHCPLRRRAKSRRLAAAAVQTVA